MNNDLILIGGGGHCRSCIDVIESENKFKIIGIIDKVENIGKKVFNYNFIGSDDNLELLSKNNKNFFITLGQIKNPNIRINLFNKLKALKCHLPIIISPLAYISHYSFVDEGTIIMHNAIINANSKIGKNCIINTNSLIEHDVVIEDNSHISTGAIINGAGIVGSNCFLGSNCVITEGIKICNNSIIGAGSVIIKDITEQGVYVGNPARKIK